MVMGPIKLGEKYADKCTGIQGTATGYAIYCAGSAQVCIEYVACGELKSVWIDEDRLEAAPQTTTGK